MTKVKTIIEPFYKQLSNFIAENKDTKTTGLYIQEQNDLHKVDIDNSYMHHDDDGQMIFRINDYIGLDNQEEIIKQLNKTTENTVKETLYPLEKSFKDFLDTYGNKEIKLAEYDEEFNTKYYYIEEEDFANELSIAFCDTQRSGVDICPFSTKKSHFYLDNNKIILKIIYNDWG